MGQCEWQTPANLGILTLWPWIKHKCFQAEMTTRCAKPRQDPLWHVILYPLPASNWDRSLSLFLPAFTMCTNYTLDCKSKRRNEMSSIILVSWEQGQELETGSSSMSTIPALKMNFQASPNTWPCFLSTWSALSYILPGCRWGFFITKATSCRDFSQSLPSTPGPTSPI